MVKENQQSFMQYLSNTATTTNGALAYKSSGSAVLDLFSTGITSKDKHTKFARAYKEDPRLAIKVALYLRDVRQGQGNRDILRAALTGMTVSDVVAILPHLAEVGSWKDVILLLKNALGEKDKSTMNSALELIKANINDSLLCKWLPREKSANKIVATAIRTYLGMNPKEYRQHLSKNSSTVENLICARNWHEIKYKTVPSISNLKYAGAFLRNDESRRRRFLEDVIAGKATTNASVMYPHDILLPIAEGHSYTYNTNDKNLRDTANAYWSQLPDFMADSKVGGVLPIIDLSGSMTWCKCPGTNARPLDIAIALGIYMAERNKGEFKNAWLPFSSEPTFQKFTGNTLTEKIDQINWNTVGYSTEIDKALDLVLLAAKHAPETAPKVLLIVSDMAFNGSVKVTNYERCKANFEAAGVEMPTIVFWRVDDGVRAAQPVIKSDINTILVNGYSTSVLKEILSGELSNITPFEAMLKIVEPKYSFVDDEYGIKLNIESK